MPRSLRWRFVPWLISCATGCTLSGDALKDRVRAALLECTNDEASATRCAELSGSVDAALATKAAATEFRSACGDIREVHVDDTASIAEIYNNKDGWSWDPGCAAGRVIADRCHGHFRFDVGLADPGPVIGWTDVVTLVAVDAVEETSPSDRHRCPRDERGYPMSYRHMHPE
jgi:hypothetical protein